MERVKLLIETGSESHTSSFASMQAKHHGGTHHGKFLYQVKEYQVNTEWDPNNDKHARWCTTIYELPAGTEIEVICRTFEGNTHRIYRLDPESEVIDEDIMKCRLHSGRVKGRLVLVRDFIAEKQAKLDHDKDEGF